MEKFPAKTCLVRVRELLDLANKLPESLNTFSDNSDETISKAVGVLEKTLGFIKTAYGQESEYFRVAGSIAFTAAGRGFIVDRNNVLHGRYYGEGRTKLVILLSMIETEESERAQLEKIMIDDSMRRYGVCLMGILLCWLIIGTAPSEVMEMAFAPTNFFRARVFLSIFVMLMFWLIVAKEKVVEIIFAGLITLALGIIPILRNDYTDTVHYTSADSLNEVGKSMSPDSIKILNSPKR